MRTSFKHQVALGAVGATLLGLLTTVPAHGAASPDLTVDGVPAVVPQPVTETAGTDGGFPLGLTTSIVITDPALQSIADYLAGLLRPATGLRLPITVGSARSTGAIVLDDSDQAALGDEGYTLASDASSVLIMSHAPAGLFHAIQTLRQLLPTQIEQSSRVDLAWTVPSVSIVDTPRYPYRGVMIDVARHFYSVANIERVIDQAAMYKLNVLHLHLSDDQGWRIAINAYPDLTTVGSLVAGRPGFYSQQDYRDIVAYAAARYITVVPEIDGPAHTTAAVTAMRTGTDPADIPIDPANPADNANVEAFLTHVAAEISALSPGPYFHIGGDESSLPAGQYDHWVTAAASASALAGRTAMGWSQIGGDPGLPAGSVLQYWSGKSGNDTGDGLAPGLTNGDKLVLSPSDAAYFDMKYDPSTPLGLTWAGYLPLSRAYDWNPDSVVAGIYAANHLTITDDRLLGVEAPLWADTVPASYTDAQVPTYSDFMLLPRLPALAEVGWSPQSTHDWAGFSARVATQAPRWTDHGYGFYASPEVQWIGFVPQPTVSTLANGATLPASPATLAGTGVAGDTVRVTEGTGTVCAAPV
ncbi:MAG: beta-N-acetylhexosaminidase, partial [Micromonosporaceae bacterium]|nr:beta-N-acetylhexosaminidase [Micromonosporaceae bacterium]